MDYLHILYNVSSMLLPKSYTIKQICYDTAGGVITHLSQFFKVFLKLSVLTLERDNSNNDVGSC